MKNLDFPLEEVKYLVGYINQLTPIENFGLKLVSILLIEKQRRKRFRGIFYKDDFKLFLKVKSEPE